MTGRAAVAWGLLALAVVAMTAGLVLWVVGVDQPLTPDIVLFPAAYLAFGGVGALIVSRQPANAIGRLALAIGVGGAVAGLADSYARLAQRAPAQDWAAWVAAWGFPATLGPILFLILLFPTGRLASRRWRPVATAVGVGIILLTVGNMLSPEFSDHPGRRNPLGHDVFVGSPLYQGGVAWFFILFGAIASSVGLVLRLGRARGVERLQLKWVAFAGALHAASWTIVAFDLPAPAGQAAQYLVFATLALIPVATGIAILRYRLYDIDVVIRRTLVYGAVVAILGAAYVALVLGLQTVFSEMTGDGTLPVALSTLAIAALFGPVRRRVREVVDRRFYRSRYDSQQTLQAFAGRMRDQVDLESVGLALMATAGQAVRPATVSVWLRQTPP